MPLKPTPIKRKEVYLTERVVDILQAQADANGRSLKKHMETILNNHAKHGKGWITKAEKEVGA